MKFTKDWLSDHLKTKKSEQQIIDKLNGIGLEVEKVEPIKINLSCFRNIYLVDLYVFSKLNFLILSKFGINFY